jgi:hypothetical protein
MAHDAAATKNHHNINNSLVINNKLCTSALATASS